MRTVSFVSPFSRKVGLWLAAALLVVGPLWAQAPDSGAAPPVQNWGDSVTLRTHSLSLRLPADAVRWREVKDDESSTRYNDVFSLVGRVQGGREVKLQVWADSRPGTCESFVAGMRATQERLRRAGIQRPPEQILESPGWLPHGDGWSPVVYSGVACRDGVGQPLLITVWDAAELTERRADIVRTMLWYLGAAAARRQL